MNVADTSCCSCKYARYEVNETDDGTYVTCSKGHELSDEMVLDEHCGEYDRRQIL